MSFQKWLEIFTEEKNINKERTFSIDKDGTWNSIPVGVVLEHMLITTPSEQTQIKDILVKIDFANGDVYHFFEHLAHAIATPF